MLRNLLLIATLLCSPAFAEVVEFTVHSSPAGAKVWAHLPGNNLKLANPGAPTAEKSYLGVAGQPLTLDVSPYTSQTGKLEIPLTLTLPDHVEARVFANNEIKDLKRWPPSGAVPLKPLSTTVAVKDFLRAYGVPLLALLAAAAGLGGYAVVQHRGRHTAEERKTELESMVVEGDPYLGTHVGEYLLADRLGAGGMAVVYRGKRRNDHDVAIKIMAPHLTGDPEFPVRFKREVQAYMQMDHPNIVRLLDWGTSPMFLAMELIHGGTLRDHIKRAGLGIPQFIAIFVPLLDAVAYAHSRGLIHRDLKPENIMLHRGKLVKVMDFGLARGQEVSQKLTASGCALGTPAYMAPEQIEGATAASADQYSLGVIAFELLSGMLPFTGDTMQVLFAHLGEPRPRVADYATGVPPKLDALVSRMIARDPAKRYPSVGHVLEELDKLFPHLTS